MRAFHFWWFPPFRSCEGKFIFPSLLNCKEKTILRHDLKQIEKIFSGTADSKEWGSAIPLIHHIPKLNVTASTGILNLGIRKPCLLIFFSMLEEVAASRVILLKMTVCLLGTHFPNPMNAARVLRLWVRCCIVCRQWTPESITRVNVFPPNFHLEKSQKIGYTITAASDAAGRCGKCSGWCWRTCGWTFVTGRTSTALFGKFFCSHVLFGFQQTA